MAYFISRAKSGRNFFPAHGKWVPLIFALNLKSKSYEIQKENLLYEQYQCELGQNLLSENFGKNLLIHERKFGLALVNF